MLDMNRLEVVQVLVQLAFARPQVPAARAPFGWVAKPVQRPVGRPDIARDTNDASPGGRRPEKFVRGTHALLLVNSPCRRRQRGSRTDESFQPRSEGYG